MKKQYAQRERGSLEYTHDCFNCGFLIDNNDWELVGVEEKDKIDNLLQGCRDAYFMDLGYFMTVKDLSAQFTMFSHLQNQKKAVELAQNKVTSRKNRMAFCIQEMRGILLDMNFVFDPTDRDRPSPIFNIHPKKPVLKADE